MPKITPFESHPNRYEEWFVRNAAAYQSELEAVKEVLPPSGDGIEIGVGTGRFAVPLGVRIGIEPSPAMGKIAASRGIEVLRGIAERLPIADASFDFALMVTTICFVDDVEASFREAARILKPQGVIIVGFVDKNSPLGRKYQQRKDESLFYREATFYSVEEVVAALRKAGFGEFAFTQTLFKEPEEIAQPESVHSGYGKGAFVVIRAVKS